MAYSRQDPAAASLTWVGKLAYTRQAANAANLAFVPIYQVSGWKATNFGTPSVTAHPVTGFMPVHFGPVGLLQKYVTGFKATTFGTPKVAEVVHPSGFQAVHFGTNITLLPHAVALRPVHFGPIRLLPHAVALRAVHFGTAVVTQRNGVQPWRSCIFGTPSVPTSQILAVTGWQAARLGTCVVVSFYLRRRHLRVQPYRVRPVHFGTPTL